MTQSIRSHKENGVLRLHLDRPSRMNAITHDMYATLAQALIAAEQDPSVRAVVIHGNEHVFSAGNDIGDFAAPAPAGERPSTRFMKAVSHLGKPLVAAVNGPAVGIGATMLLHCDLVFVGTNLSLHFPFVELGLCPEFASSLLLPRRVGQQRASQLLLLGQVCSAQEAQAMGLANVVCDPSETLAQALNAAGRIARFSEEAVLTTKRLMRQAEREETVARLTEENEQFGALMQTERAQQAFAAFLHKKAS